VEERDRKLKCALCNETVPACEGCKRRYRYCSAVCSQAARRDSVRRAQEQYQKTDAGRRANARRQREYYRRQKARKKNLTHQSSPDPGPSGTIRPQSTRSASEPGSIGRKTRREQGKEILAGGSCGESPISERQPDVTRCYFCGRALGSVAMAREHGGRDA
jgi:hypothetical protein